MRDLRKQAAALLSQMNKLSEAQFHQRLSQLFNSHEIAGPLTVAWMLRQMHKNLSGTRNVVLGRTG